MTLADRQVDHRAGFGGDAGDRRRDLRRDLPRCLRRRLVDPGGTPPAPVTPPRSSTRFLCRYPGYGDRPEPGRVADNPLFCQVSVSSSVTVVASVAVDHWPCRLKRRQVPGSRPGEYEPQQFPGLPSERIPPRLMPGGRPWRLTWLFHMHMTMTTTKREGQGGQSPLNSPR